MSQNNFVDAFNIKGTRTKELLNQKLSTDLTSGFQIKGFHKTSEVVQKCKTLIISQIYQHKLKFISLC